MATEILAADALSETMRTLAGGTDGPLAALWSARVATHLQDTYAGIPMSTFPEDLRTYERILWERAPVTVIEVGVGDGGSALWLRDRLFDFQRYRAGRAPRVIGVDVDLTAARRSFAGLPPEAVAGIELVEGDIADQDTDAIVTAAHWDLAGGQGTDGAVHFKAGPRLLEECRGIGACPIGGAVITAGYDLRARHVIPAVGPVWEKGKLDEAALLRSAYTQSLQLAADHRLRTIAFPSISTGAFGYPMHLAAPVAMAAIVGFLRQSSSTLEVVRMVLYPRESQRARAIYEGALRAVLE